jgi:hypothetical protein
VGSWAVALDRNAATSASVMPMPTNIGLVLVLLLLPEDEGLEVDSADERAWRAAALVLSSS